ncbi:FtsX-like permease family protein [Candidatus Parcubacteria bacterium]|nr:MAG: FtsX-like permease family protein [Candidatus Parcubacteria bacterium]
MSGFNILKISLDALKKNKIRSFLTIFGIVIGISAVIIVMSAGKGLEGLVLSELEAFGTDFIEIEVKVPNTKHTSSENAVGMVQGITVTTLKFEDAEAIEKLPNVISSYSAILGQEIVSFEGENKQGMLFGSSASFIDLDPSEVGEGRFFSQDEESNLSQVAVLGSAIKGDLFGPGDAVGKSVKIGKLKFEVIGVMEEQGGGAFFDRDNLVFLPLSTLQKKIMGVDYVSFILAKVEDNSMAKATADEITMLLRDRHNISGNDKDKDDFAVITMQEALDMLDTVFGAITLLLIALAGISLIVGGVGIMNIMYVSVAERTYEIGLRKSVGASKQDILLQFLFEAVAVTFAGAVLGILIGILFSFLIYVGATSQGLNWRFIITPLSVVLACGFSVALGLIFGLWPAKRASELDPVEALRR